MKKNAPIIILLFFLLGSCNRERKIILSDENKLQGIESIEYLSSERHGNFINFVAEIGSSKYHYNIQISSYGQVLHVIKYDNVFNNKEENIESYRSMQVLISDTSKKNAPTFFQNDINGVYTTDTFIVNNVIANLDVKTRFNPLSTEEKYFFSLIDSLSKSKNIQYQNFDTSKLLGWFSYVF